MLVGNFIEDGQQDSFAHLEAKRQSVETQSHSHRVHAGRQIEGSHSSDRVEGSLSSTLLFGHCGDEKMASFGKRRFGTTKQLAESEIAKTFVQGEFGFPQVPRRPRHAEMTNVLDSNSRLLRLRK